MEKIERDEDERSISPTDKQYADFEPAAVPIAPDGGIVPGFGLESPSSLPSMADSVCVKGPCRHYWHVVTDVDMENPESTWGEGGLVDPLTGKHLEKPRQHHHTCLASPSMEMNLNGDCVYECSKWDPTIPAELHQLAARRKVYLDAHPEPEEEVDESDSPDHSA